MILRLSVLVSLLFICSACGGGGSNSTANAIVTEPIVVEKPTEQEPVIDEPDVEIFTGIFVDSFVRGLNYITESQTGTTNAAGEFTYKNGESITFSIGDIFFPTIDATSVITPLTIFNSDNINDIAVVNMLRLLQTLDMDGNAGNGIEISDEAHLLALGTTITFSDDNFDQLVGLIVEGSGALNQNLISADDALYHFSQTLAGQKISTCGSTNSKVGYSGTFQTYAHNVSGTATILDDCTIMLSNFDYDGGGPEVYAYAATDHQYQSADAFSVSNRLNGESYNNAEILFHLPNNKTLDDLTGISIWCVDFNANFGELTFTP